MVFEGGVSGKSLGHEGKTLVNETSALIKDTPKNSLVKFQCEVTMERRTFVNQEVVLTRHHICWCLHLGPLASRTVKKNRFLLLFISNPYYSTIL